MLLPVRECKTGAVPARSRRPLAGLRATVCGVILAALAAPTTAQDDGERSLVAPRRLGDSAAARHNAREVSPITTAAAYRAMSEKARDFTLLRAGREMQQAGRSRVDVLKELLRRRDTHASPLGKEHSGWLGNLSEDAVTGFGGAFGGVAGLFALELLPGHLVVASGPFIGATAGGVVVGAVAAGWAAARLRDFAGVRGQRNTGRAGQDRPWNAVLLRRTTGICERSSRVGTTGNLSGELYSNRASGLPWMTVPWKRWPRSPNSMRSSETMASMTTWSSSPNGSTVPGRWRSKRLPRTLR